MRAPKSKYYAEISILVDGWPWNLSEFDFRRFFADGSCPAALLPSENRTIADKAPAPQVSGNRRAKLSRAQKKRNRNAARKKAA